MINIVNEMNEQQKLTMQDLFVSTFNINKNLRLGKVPNLDRRKSADEVVEEIIGRRE